MDQKIKKLTGLLVAIVLLVTSVVFNSCEKVKEIPIPFNASTPWSFKTDVQPIFDANCITCHNGSRSPDLRDGKSYSALSKGYINQPGSGSRLYVKISSSTTHIPKTTDSQKLIILNWINQGAKNN